MDIEDRLEVKVVEARGLVPPRGAGGTCNPSVFVSCDSETIQTKTQSRTNAPQWKDAEPMAFFHVAEGAANHLVCRVCHKDLVTGRSIPLGTVTIPLSTALLSPEIPIDEWFPIIALGDGLGDASEEGDLGSVHVIVTYFLDDNFGMDEGDAGDASNQLPNCLVASVARARNLAPVDNKQTCDAYASVSVHSSKQSTKVVRGTNSPSWDQTFALPVTDGYAFAEVKVKHKSLMSRKLIGSCRIPLVEIAGAGPGGLRKWFKLLSADYELSPEPRGEIELTLTWKYDSSFKKAKAKPAPVEKGRRGRPAPPPKANNTGLVEDDDEEPELNLSVAEMEALEQARKERVEKAKKQIELYDAMTSDVKAGDYQVQAHILEVTDLKGESSSGLSNPRVTVNCMGLTQRTRVVKQVSRCVFDEKLFFNFKNVDPTQIQEAEVKLTVASKNMLSTPVIGTYQVNLLSIYGREDHELYDQWVALTDPSNKDDTGVQGYLKVSLTVLGPGDKQKFHDLEKEYEEAKEKEESGAVSGPDIKPKLHFLVVSVFWAADLPMMESGITGSGTNCYVRVDFAGNPPLKTKKDYVRGRSGLSPEFMEQLWIPVMDPTMSTRIALSLWDHDFFSGDKLVAHTYFDYRDVPQLDKEAGGGGGGFFGSMFGRKTYQGPPPRWANLYGAPLDVRGRKAGKVMNTYPDSASTYRGRILLGMYVDPAPSKKEIEFIHKKEFDFDVPDSLIPAVAYYTIRASVLLGSEIPIFKFPNADGAAKMKVMVDFGCQRLEFPFRANKRGQIEWLENAERKDIELPADMRQLPDVGIYLVRGPESQAKTVSWARVPAARLLAESFSGAPYWQTLEPDHSRDKTRAKLGATNYPGALLLRLGLGLTSDASSFKWKDDRKVFEDKRPYCLRVHVYQGRSIPAKDANGLIDPYVKVRFCGSKQKTRVAKETTDPLYYQTLEFHETLPGDLKFAPEVVLTVWDQDVGGANSQVGLLRYSLVNAKLTKTDSSPPAPPQWLALEDLNGGPTSGALLVSFQLIQKRDPGEKYGLAMPIAPPCTRGASYIEVIALGVRDMAPYNYEHVKEPKVRFDLPGIEENFTFTTRSSRYPRGRDANFLEKQIMVVQLPDNPAYAPMLAIRAYDRRLGGLKTVLVGATSISLSTKLPWNSEGYVPPQSQLFDEVVEDSEEVKEPVAVPKVEGPVEDEDDEPEDADGDAGVTEQKTSEETTPAPGTNDGGTGAFLALPRGTEAVSFPHVKEDVELLKLLANRVEPEATVVETEEEQASWWATDLANIDLAFEDDEEMSLADLGIEFPSSWVSAQFRAGRDWWVKQNGGEVEQYLDTAPFERYPLFRGVYHPNPEKSTIRQVGTFKGIIRVCESDPRMGAQLIDMRALQAPQKFTVRLYVVSGKNLQPTGGGLSDPYIRIRLGTQYINDTSSVQKQTLDPAFFKSYEVETTIPGPTSLKIELRDWQRFLPTHELIGSTTVDLEDRWFHKKWQGIKTQKNSDGILMLEPLEMRNLYSPDSAVAQGQLEMWVEILPTNQAGNKPKSELFGPPEKKFELRIIVWKSKDVPKHRGINLFNKVELQGFKAKQTDTHWKCKGGAGSWNWRMKFPVTFPVKSPLYGRLNVQMWNRDIISSNDIISEYAIDLYPWFLLAYHREDSVFPFQEMKEAKARQAQLQSATPVEDEGEGDGEGEGEEEGGEGAEGKSMPKPLIIGQDEYATAEIKMVDGDVFEDGEEEGQADEERPFLEESSEEEEEEEEEEEADEDALNALWDAIGMGKIAEDAQWLKMMYHNAKRKRLEPKGKLAVSIQIVPWAEVEARPVGNAQDDPNTNPFLPPPVGRMSFSFNPLSILKELIGPETVICIICICCCVMCLFALMFLGQYYVTAYTMIQSF